MLPIASDGLWIASGCLGLPWIPSQVRLKKAAFQFKKKFMAEALLLGEAGAPSTAPTGFVRPPPAVDYEAEWASGSELSDAFELDDDAVAEAEQETAPSSTMRSGSRPRH